MNGASAEIKALFDNKYRAGEEIFRSSKAYTLNVAKSVCRQGGQSLLDLGCGTGKNSEILRDFGYQVTGVDISEEAIRKYKARGLEGRTMDLNSTLDFANESFDSVFLSEVIEHVISPSLLISEISRILKPKGQLILSTPNSSFWLYRWLSLLGYTLSEVQHPQHLHFFSKRSLKNLLLNAGFKTLSCSGRNIYFISPSWGQAVDALLCNIGFKEEKRFRTGGKFLHLSNYSTLMNSFFSDTLIICAHKI
jgi:2-polyprenyl-3-methyl-5-hydroxy-6-metoxy-1,4-benzoquinol methylase